METSKDIDESLNDSDDGVILKTLKRKMHLNPESPKAKKRDVSKQSTNVIKRTASRSVNNQKPSRSIKSLEECILKSNNSRTKSEKCLSEGSGVDNLHTTVVKQLCCPLCRKTFETSSSHISHMKQCAKKKNVSTSDLLNAYEGGTSVEVKKNKLVKKPIKEIAENTYDLSLGIALSISTGDGLGRNVNRTEVIDQRVVQDQKTTLEKFGFTSSSAPATGSRKGKALISRNTILKSRTSGDRLKLLTEKAAVVLLSEDNPNISFTATASDENRPPLDFEVEVPKLWELGGHAEGSSWYIEDLKRHLVSPSKLSTDSNSTEDDLGNCSDNAKSTDFDLSPYLLDTFLNATDTLGDDWLRIFKSSEGCDLTIAIKGAHVKAHSLVLQARCPGFLKLDYENCFKDVNSSTMSIVLEYLYSGRIREMKHSQLEPALNLSRLLECSGLADILIDLKTAVDQRKRVSSSPKSQNGKEQTKCLESEFNNYDKPDDDEADTVPNYTEEPEHDEVSVMTPPEKSPADTVDLTMVASPANDDVNEAERSFHTMLNLQKKRAELEREQWEEHVMESFEHQQELWKIETSMKQHSEGNKSLVDDLEKTELHESQIEREKILNLSRSEDMMEQDLFASDGEDVQLLEEKVSEASEDVQVLETEKLNEVIDISSESGRDENFGATTDEDNTEMDAKVEPPATLDFSRYDPPEFDEYMDFFDPGPSISENVLSQSLIGVGQSPKTPKKVFSHSTREVEAVSDSKKPETTPSKHNEDMDVFDPGPPINENVLSQSLIGVGQSPKTPKRVFSHCTSEVSETEANPSRHDVDAVTPTSRREIFPPIINRELMTPTPPRMRATRPVKKLHSRRAKNMNVDSPKDILTTSIIAGFEATWDEEKTPDPPSQSFVEVTPVPSSSYKLVNRRTPTPRFSTMKPSTMKKLLQKYGLKKTLGPTKSRKILQHIYDELHPIVNTKTGKLVKMSKAEGNKTKRKAIPARQKPGRRRKSQPSKNAKVKSPVQADRVDVDNLPELPNSPENDDFYSSTEDMSDFDMDKLIEDEDDLCSQRAPQTMKVETAIRKYIAEHAEFHEKILRYEPIWIEELKNALLTEYNLKFKLADIVAFLDDQCITFRSAAQAVANAKRNDRRKARVKKKSQKASD